jgi:hypothetical protein
VALRSYERVRTPAPAGGTTQRDPFMRPNGTDPSNSTGAPGPRPRRRALVTAVGILGTAALFVVAAPVARATTVPYAVDFDAPAIPVGGVDQAYLDCPTDVGADVTVSVTSPTAVSTDYVTAGTDSSSTVPGRVFVDVGPSGLFPANQAGTYSATVKCPGYDPYTTSFAALVPTLGLTVAIDRDYDCTTVETGYSVGDRPNLCFAITNNTGQDIRRFGLDRPDGTSFEYPAAGDFPAGATQVLLTNGSGAVPFAGTTLGGLFVWAEIGQENSGVFAVSAVNSMEVAALPAPLTLVTTTGLTAATACADNGGLVDRIVDPGTSVYVCYRVTNTSGVTYTTHGLDDSLLGSLLTFFPVDLKRGDSYSFVVPAPVVVSADAMYTGTWSSIDGDPYSALPDGYVATVTASATIEVTAPVVPGPVPEPVVTQPVTTSTALAADTQAVSASPAFTG